MDSATKSEPPDCGIVSLSSREYVCLQYQPKKQSDLIEIDRKGMKTIFGTMPAEILFLIKESSSRKLQFSSSSPRGGEKSSSTGTLN